MSDHEIDQLIFEPGFSTAEVVSDVSGRGVGMDVVRKNIESMRGSINVSSVPGEGTEICLELPLTLSIIDGTVIRVGDRHFIIPTLSVIEQIQASVLDYSQSDVGTLLQFRGHFIPSHRFGDLVGTNHFNESPNGQVCMVVESGQRHMALIVDEVVGQQPVVIKPLGGILEVFDRFAGGALLGDGEIAFVVDLNNLCRTPPLPTPHMTNESRTTEEGVSK